MGTACSARLLPCEARREPALPCLLFADAGTLVGPAGLLALLPQLTGVTTLLASLSCVALLLTLLPRVAPLLTALSRALLLATLLRRLALLLPSLASVLAPFGRLLGSRRLAVVLA